MVFHLVFQGSIIGNCFITGLLLLLLSPVLFTLTLASHLYQDRTWHMAGDLTLVYRQAFRWFKPVDAMWFWQSETAFHLDLLNNLGSVALYTPRKFCGKM